MKNFYLAVTVHNEQGYYSYIAKVSTNDNALSKLKIKDIINANICESKKIANEIVTAWNNAYKENDTYMFRTINKEV